MSITEKVPVPTSYRRLQEKKIFNVHARLLFVWATASSMFGFYVITMWNLCISNVFVYLIPGVILSMIVFAIARDVHTLDRSKMHVLLIFRIIRNKHITKKYIAPVDDLKKIVPIDAVEDSGLIRYVNGASGIIVMLDPPRIAEDDIERHSIKMKNVINSLYGDFTFQFLTTSISNFDNPLLDATKEAMKAKDTPQEITAHLNSLYTEAVEQDNVISWQFILLVTIPITKDIKEAEKLKNAFMSGLSKELSRAGMFSRVVEDRNEVVGILRGCIC